jgi:uncharacterized membrane protein YGL010W
MRSADEWFAEYGESHVNPTNKLIHWICVPAIVISVIGMLWSLPVPAAFEQISPALNWGTAFVMAAVVYYFLMSVTLGLGMVVIVLGMMAVVHWLDGFSTPLWLVSLVIFVVAWIGQFIGHIVEGKKPSFFKDLQFLMIGPAWLLGFIYRRLGIPY